MKTFFTVLFIHIWFISQVASTTYSCDHSASCGCSRNDAILDKIVGGEAARSSSWGWAVSLRDSEGEHVCGAAMVSPTYVVTAAHCVSDPLDTFFGMSIAVGMDRLNESKTVGQVRQVKEFIPHPQYNRTTKANDIAVLRLNSSLSLSISASTARLCLPRINTLSDVYSYPPVSSSLVAVGWGTLFSGAEDVPNQLQQVTINAIPLNDTTCYPSIYSPELQFCGGVYGGGKDTCQGDSGGPLMRFEVVKRQWVLVGVTSYGKGCGHPLYAGIYTRMTPYIDWLRNIIGNDGLVELEIDTSVVQTTITATMTPSTAGTTTKASISTTSTRTTTQTSVRTSSWSMNNRSSVKNASYSFTFLFLFLIFPNFF